MTTKQDKPEKVAKLAEAGGDEDVFLPLTPEQLEELEEQRRQAVAGDAARARDLLDRVRGLKAPVENAGD